MNDHLTISTFELFRMFPDAEAARVCLESCRWPQGPRCPVCGLTDRITVRKAGYYRCNQCKEDFTVRTAYEQGHHDGYMLGYQEGFLQGVKEQS